MIELGLASKFLVSDKEKNDFAQAEKQAIDREVGIWNKSIYYGCFNSDINKKSEVAVLENTCSIINMNTWILKDEGRKPYKFQNISIGIIKIHSGKGNDNSTDVFWNIGEIWNNDRDSLYLFDSGGNIAHYEVYGY